MAAVLILCALMLNGNLPEIKSQQQASSTVDVAERDVLMSVLASLSEPVIMIKDQLISFVNHAACSTLDYESPAALVDQHLSILFRAEEVVHQIISVSAYEKARKAMVKAPAPRCQGESSSQM